MSLGTKLYELRQKKNLSQAQVALELDISQAAYGKWESDLSKPGIDNLLKISNFYETDIYELLLDSSGDSFSNNSFDSSSNSSNYISKQISTINNYFSEKLEQQYEERLKQKDEEIAFLKSLLDK